MPPLVNFVVLYRGPTPDRARMVGITLDPDLVEEVAARIVNASSEADGDAALLAIERGKRRAARLIRREVHRDHQGET